MPTPDEEDERMQIVMWLMSHRDPRLMVRLDGMIEVVNAEQCREDFRIWVATAPLEKMN